MLTPWGYEVDGLPPIMDEEEFNLATGGAHDGDGRLALALEAASMAIRNECGWHVTPSLECRADVTATGRMAVLPSRAITGVSLVTDGGAELGPGDFEASRDGLLRRTCWRNWSRGLDAVHVEYTAGYGDLPDLKTAAMHLAEAALSVPQGVASESAGGVAISYSAQAHGIASAMVGGMGATLAPYRLVSSHVA